MSAVIIRAAADGDREAIWRILRAVFGAGDTFAFDASTSREEALTAWFPSGGFTFVAERDGAVVGSYMCKANQPGLGNHVANAGYVVAEGNRGGGVGEAMCRHSLDEAKRRGFRAMQFNFVVSTNERAVALWQRLGFAIVGRVPASYRHATLGLVETYIMHRAL